MSLPRAMVKTLGKEFLRKNKKKILCRRSAWEPSVKKLVKKKFKSLFRGPAWEPSAKKLPKKNLKILCRVPTVGPSAKTSSVAARGLTVTFFLPTAGVSPRQNLCRVPDKWPSAKIPFPTENFPRALCRGQPLAKSLPRAI